MTSLTGNKERSSAPTRSRKHAIIDASPTKSASYTQEMWYRKTCEESRSGSRKAPEGAGSVPGSSGTPSPGSGISSPGSFTGSPGTTSPGVCTGSPGSLGGSPGFGTGSPGSGSGSSPGSDRGVWCENCNARLIELKRQALKLLIPGPFSSKDPSFPALLNDKLQVPNSARKAWNERDGRCDVCATHLSQLKQEAVYMVLSLEQAACPEGPDQSPNSPPPFASLPLLVGSCNILQGLPRDRTQPSAAHPLPSSGGPGPAPVGFPNHGSKPSSLGIGSGVERRGGKPGAQLLPQQPTAPSNSSALSSVALQAHQYLESMWSVSRANGVTLYPCQVSQPLVDGPNEGQTEATLNRCNAERPLPHSFPAPHVPPVTAAPSGGTSAAASFFARAAQKLNLSSKKKKPRATAPPVCDTPPFPTNFSGILQTSPPPAPPCLLRAVSKVKDTPGLGKVKVMLRVCPILSSDASESRSFLKVDPRKKQVTIMDPGSSLSQGAQQKRAGGIHSSPKIFAFDATFSHEASQAEVCAGTVAEVIQSVVNGADGCVFCFGHANLGKSYTMIGKDDSTQNLGIIPCTISWLFKLISERKEKTGARFSVRVSAVEVSGKDEVLTDLLSEVATGSLQDGQSPGVYLCEDPICGMQLQNQSELRAPTPEKAAYFLDAAIAARSSSRPRCREEEHRNSHMLFTLHVYQYRMDKASKGGMTGGRSRLHLIDLGSCVKVLSKSRDVAGGPCLSLSALGNVILALVNGSKHIPYKDSKLTMLLRESLGNMNCRTTMIAHISSSPCNFSETLSTIQTASRVLRMKKKKAKQYTSSSSGGESSCEEGRMRRPTHLRTLHFRNAMDSELPLLHLSSDHDDYSSSEQSCDTVIYVGPDGTALSDKELTDNEGPPEFVPIVPSLQRNKNEKGVLLLQPPLQEPQAVQQPLQQGPPSEETQLGKPEQDCLKCNTFAELQERLECIDGSEEVNCFPFEELPAIRSSEADPSQTSTQTAKYGQDMHEGMKQLCSQQLGDIQAVTAEGHVTHCIIENLAQSSPDNCDLSSSRCVPGSSSKLPNDPLQEVETFTLIDSKEALSTNNYSESKPRTMGSPRLGVASLTKTSEYKPQSSPALRCKLYTQKVVLPNLLSLSSLSLSRDAGNSSTESLLQPETRTSPVGMGPQVKKSTSPSIVSSSDMLSEDPVQPALENKIEVRTSTTLTVQQPLELNEEDELVFTLVKELSISGVVENGRPTSIISFNSDCSVQALASGSRPVSIISSISEDLEGFPIPSSSTTQATSAVSITQFLPLSSEQKILLPGEHSAINSWLRDLGTSSDGELHCPSSNAEPACYQRKRAAEPLHCNLAKVQSDTGGNTEPDGHSASVKGKTRVLKEIPHFSDATVTISSVQNVANAKDLYPIKTIITFNPSDTAKTTVKRDFAELSPCMKSTQWKDVKIPPVSISSKIKFEDPWMKRETEESKIKQNVCVVKPEKKMSWSGTNQSQTDSFIPQEEGCLADSLKRVVDGCEMVLKAPESLSPVSKEDILRTASLPRGWRRLNRQDDVEESSSSHLGREYSSLGVTTSTPCSPRATLERKGSPAKQSMLAQVKGIPPLPPVRRSSLDQKNRVSFQCSTGSTSMLNQTLTFTNSPFDDVGNNARLKGPNVESSRLFSAKLEQLANRTNSLGRSHAAGNYECFFLERANSLTSVGSRSSSGKECMARVGRSLRRDSVSSPTTVAIGNNNTPQKGSPSKISAVSKLLMANPKARSLSASSTKTLSFSTKSLPQSVNRSSSLPPNGKNQNQNSWSTQSLSRSRGSGLASKLPLKAVNGRISELLQGSASHAAHVRGTSSVDDSGWLKEEERQATQALPSPYSKITAPRRPHRYSSGHASDNSSVLSGELPPAMGKTALFYHSGGSSGYESMIRDSEATGSTSSAQDSTSDNSSSISGRRSIKNQKKRNNIGSQKRRLVPALAADAASPARKPVISPGLRWVDGPLRASPRGLADTFEIKVYEIDDVERLQRRRGAANKEMIFFSAKLKILEHRQQRISTVRAKYDWLKKELEQTKQHLMLAPEKWTSEFDLQQTFEVDSLEYLEALEFVTGQLESRVNFCKAHLMMITCFDVTSRRR